MSDYFGVAAALALVGFGVLALASNNRDGPALTTVGLVLLSGTAFQVSAGKLKLTLSARRLAEAALLQIVLAALGIVLGIFLSWILFLLAAVAGISLIAMGISVHLTHRSPYRGDAQQVLGRTASLFRASALPTLALALGGVTLVMIVGPRAWNMGPLAATLLFAVPFATGLVAVVVAAVRGPSTPKWCVTELPPAGARLATRRELVAQLVLDLPMAIASVSAMTLFFATLFIGLFSLVDLAALGASVRIAKFERAADTKVLSDLFTPYLGVRHDASKTVYAEMSRLEYEQQHRSMSPKWFQAELGA